MGKYVEDILKLREQFSDRHVADYLYSIFQTAGFHVQRETFFYSRNSAALAGGAAFILAAIFLFGVFRRKQLVIIGAAFAVPCILFFEFSLGIPLVSWPLLKKGENIIVQFPVQNPSGKVALGAPYEQYQEEEQALSPAETAASAFLLPAALAFLSMGLWQLAIHFGKFDSEDARTILLVMGGACLAYFAWYSFVVWDEGDAKREASSSSQDVGSMAMLSQLALNLRNEDLGLENTWVSVVFFGGDDGQGAKTFAKKLSRSPEHSIETIFIGCRRIGRGERLAFLFPLEERSKNPLSERRLLRILSSDAAAAGERTPEILPVEPDQFRGFAGKEFPYVIFTSLPPEGGAADESDIQPNQLEPALHVLEKMLVQLDAEHLNEHSPPPTENEPVSRTN